MNNDFFTPPGDQANIFPAYHSPKYIGLVLPIGSLSDGTVDKNEFIFDFFDSSGDDGISGHAVGTPAHARTGVYRPGE